jgi:hypothetical protein
MNQYLENFFFQRNILIGSGNGNAYPTGNFFVQSTNDVGFVDAAIGDFRLAQSSPYRSAGTDRRDVGADIDGLSEATMIAVSGQV